MRTVFWLAVLVAGFALGSWLTATRDGGFGTAPDPAHAVSAERLLPFPLAELTGIAFVQGNRHARIIRADEGWTYAAGQVRGAGDGRGTAQFIEQRVAMFSAARVERSMTVGENDAARYGLGPGGLAVMLSTRSGAGSPRTLRVGSRTPDGFGQYVYLEQAGRVVVVPAYHIENLLELAAGPLTRHSR